MGEQLSLSYEALTNVAGRPYIREKFKISNEVAYWIPLNEISLREGFNKREDYEGLEELADSILEHDLREAFELSVLKDGRNLVKAGHRRYYACQILVERKAWPADRPVKFYPVASTESELFMLLDQIISNNTQKPFTPLEQSKVVYEAKHNFSEKPKSNDELAKMLSVSRQTIDNLVKIAEAPDDIKDQMRKGHLSYTGAISLLNSKKKLQKQTDDEELKQGQSAMYVQPGPKDSLASEMKELDELEAHADEIKEINEFNEQQKVKNEAARLKNEEETKAISDEINVSQETIATHVGRKLSFDVTAGWTDNFIDEDTGEVVPVDRTKVIAYKGESITEEVAKSLVAEKVETIFVYQVGKEPVVKSVITVAPENEEKVRYDESRPEIAQIQNIIKLGDKLDVMVSKLDVPDGVKNDVENIVKWMRNDALELREWVHKNKKQNKVR